MMLKLALRNCLRNRRRSAVTGLSVLLAVLIVILLMSFMYTCFDQMADNERKFRVGDVRIRAEKYNEFESLMPLQFHIKDYGALKEELLSIPSVSGVESVLNLPASLYTDGKLASITVCGADPGSVYIGDDTILYEGRFA
ncbi:MAG: hypothetical protein ACI4NM_11280, partial [Bullifex sp.]